MVEAGVAQDRIHVFGTYANAAQAVQDGRVNAYASVARAHLGYLQNGRPDLALVEVSPREKPPALGCFAFASAATDLKNSVDRVLNQFFGGAGHLKLMSEFGFELDDINRIL
ncbi:hypothetical protein [Ruegeria discodermiae]|uniref:hypothetical protein n=1 Tax=Ruegeria discodermiae TaxID=3064389 RepID=UPI003531C48F